MIRSSTLIIACLLIAACTNSEQLGKNEQYRKDLAQAIFSGDAQAVSELVDVVDLNPECGFHEICKPIIIAIEKGTPEMVQLMIDAGADVDGEGAYLDNPLIYAILEQKEEVIGLLLEAGADVNKPNAFGISPFIGACGSDEELAKKFLQYGGDVHARYKISVNLHYGEYGPTPLMYATEGGQLGMVKMLLEHGVDTSEKNYDGKTAKDLAKENNHTDIVSLLEKSQ